MPRPPQPDQQQHQKGLLPDHLQDEDEKTENQESELHDRTAPDEVDDEEEADDDADTPSLQNR